MINSLTEMRANAPFICPTCKTQTYFSRQIQWPTDRDARGPNNIAYAYESHSATKDLHIAMWSCLGCPGRVVLLYPNGLTKGAIRIWPLGSVRSLGDAETVSKCVPKAIQDDFKEAALIEELSSKASATLSRRCLQFILNDKFADVIKDRKKLNGQVKAVLEAKVLPEHILAELHGIRSIGNSGAHTKVDPENNEIVEIEPGEAAACLDVIEQMVEHVYLKPFLAAQRKAAREKKFGPDTQ